MSLTKGAPSRAVQASVARRRAVQIARPARDAAVHAATDAISPALDPADQVNLEAPLDPHPDLVRGQLENGLEYVILPNKSPPGRFEAHLQACPARSFLDRHVQHVLDDAGAYCITLGVGPLPWQWRACRLVLPCLQACHAGLK